MNNNSVALVIIGVLGFFGVLIFGKVLLDSKKDRHHCPPPAPQIIQTPAPQPQTLVPVPVPVPIPIHQGYHNNNDFWVGYRDGYTGRSALLFSPEYLAGYRAGKQDRGCGRPDYFNNHCPPNFKLQINIR